MNVEELKEILKGHNIPVAGKFDQYFLIDEGVIARGVEYGDIKGEEVVLEIGAGIGNITEKIERRAKKVYAVERDGKLCEILKERCDRSKTEVIEGDFMKIELPEFDKVVANIPFSLSSPIIYKLLLHGFNLAILICQKEFALKMTAKPAKAKYSRLSVISQALAEVEILEFIPRSAFYPPSVESAIVKLVGRGEAREEKRFFFDFVSTAFMQRRKKMRNIIKPYLQGKVVEFEPFIVEILDRRPEELTPEEFLWLVKFISKHASIDLIKILD